MKRMGDTLNAFRLCIHMPSEPLNCDRCSKARKQVARFPTFWTALSQSREALCEGFSLLFNQVSLDPKEEVSQMVLGDLVWTLAG